MAAPEGVTGFKNIDHTRDMVQPIKTKQKGHGEPIRKA